MHFRIDDSKAFLDLEKDMLRIDSRVYSLNNEASSCQNRVYIKFNSNCNIHCVYCYQNDADRIKPINNINKYFRLLNKLQCFEDIVIFGGEPLIESNLENIQFFLSLDKTKKVTFFTNGYHSTHVKEFLLKNSQQIERLIITIDGPEEIHNIRRISSNGLLYHDLIDNVKSYLKININTNIQINIDADNLSYVTCLLDQLEELFSDVRKQKVILNRVLHSNKSICASQLMELYVSIISTRCYKNIKIHINSLVFEKLNSYINNMGIINERCFAGRTMVFDFTNETIYGCPEDENTVIGSFNYSDYLLIKDKCKTIIDYTSKNKSVCYNCKLKKVCGYGCFIDQDIDGQICYNESKKELKTILDNFNIIFR